MATIDQIAQTQRSQANMLSALSAAVRRTQATTLAVQQAALTARLDPPPDMFAMPVSLGSSAADTLGNTYPTPSGGYNRLQDPTLEALVGGDLTTSFAYFGPHWSARYVLNSGTVPHRVQMMVDKGRVGSMLCPLRSSMVKVEVESIVTDAAFDLTVEIDNAELMLTSSPLGGLPYFVNAVQAYWSAEPNHSAFSATLDLMTGATVCDSSAAFSGYDWQQLIAHELAHAGFHFWRLRVNVVGVATTPLTTVLRFGEPQMVRAVTDDAPPYEPNLGRWEPTTATTLTIATSLVNAGTMVCTPSSAQTLAAATAILANAEVVQVDATADRTLTATPTIADGTDGQVLTILNVDSTDTITLQDQGTLAGSNLRLTANTIALGPRDSVKLLYSGSIGDWVQVGTVVNVL
jgi:hypothetical protein